MQLNRQSPLHPVFRARQIAASGSPAMTLIELLTVVAIVGILSTILIPVIRSVRQSALDAKAVSSLRQLGPAIDMFALDYADKFPPGVTTSSDYTTVLNPYLSQDSASTWGAVKKRSEVFKDPAADYAGGSYHFSVNPNFMPDLQQWKGEGAKPADIDRMISRSVMTRPAEQIVLAEGSQLERINYGSMATLYSIPGMWNRYPNRSSDTPIERTPRLNSAGYLGWRAANGQGVKCLFGDGHVAIMKEGELLQKHFQKDL